MDQQLPPDFQALMEDGTPVTAHNLLEYLAEYWTKPDNGYYIACMQMDTELNRLYPNASVEWEPPRVFKEPIVATLQVTHV